MELARRCMYEISRYSALAELLPGARQNDVQKHNWFLIIWLLLFVGGDLPGLAMNSTTEQGEDMQW